MNLQFHFRNTRRAPCRLMFLRKPVRLEAAGTRAGSYEFGIEDVKDTEKLLKIWADMVRNGIVITMTSDINQDAITDPGPDLPPATLKTVMLNSDPPVRSHMEENMKLGVPLTASSGASEILGVIEDDHEELVDMNQARKAEPLRVIRNKVADTSIPKDAPYDTKIVKEAPAAAPAEDTAVLDMLRAPQAEATPAVEPEAAPVVEAEAPPAPPEPPAEPVVKKTRKRRTSKKKVAEEVPAAPEAPPAAL